MTQNTRNIVTVHGRGNLLQVILFLDGVTYKRMKQSLLKYACCCVTNILNFLLFPFSPHLGAHPAVTFKTPLQHTDTSELNIYYMLKLTFFDQYRRTFMMAAAWLWLASFLTFSTQMLLLPDPASGGGCEHPISRHCKITYGAVTCIWTKADFG